MFLRKVWVIFYWTAMVLVLPLFLYSLFDSNNIFVSILCICIGIISLNYKIIEAWEKEYKQLNEPNVMKEFEPYGQVFYTFVVIIGFMFVSNPSPNLFREYINSERRVFRTNYYLFSDYNQHVRDSVDGDYNNHYIGIFFTFIPYNLNDHSYMVPANGAKPVGKPIFESE